MVLLGLWYFTVVMCSKNGEDRDLFSVLKEATLRLYLRQSLRLMNLILLLNKGKVGNFLINET